MSKRLSHPSRCEAFGRRRPTIHALWPSMKAWLVGLRRPNGLPLALATIAALAATAAPASAQLRDKWCSKVNIRFFVGGAEGDAFAAIVYNGARQAAADTGAKVDYLFSGWDRERMIQQLREAVAARPDGIAMMGHPGAAAITPLAQQAAAANIKMMYQNVDVPDVRARFGGGYIGANQVVFGRALGQEAIKRLGLKAGDHALVFSGWANEVRSAGSAAHWCSTT